MSQSYTVAIDRDAEHLKIISICHYVYAGLSVMQSCVGLLYICMGVFFFAMPFVNPATNPTPPVNVVEQEDTASSDSKKESSDEESEGEEEEGQGDGLGPPSRGSSAGPKEAFMGIMLIVMGGILFFLPLIFGICVFIAGRFIAKRKGYVYCLIVGAFTSMGFPMGTILAVFTFIVLSRQSVKSLFEQTAAQKVAAAGAGSQSVAQQENSEAV